MYAITLTKTQRKKLVARYNRDVRKCYRLTEDEAHLLTGASDDFDTDLEHGGVHYFEVSAEMSASRHIFDFEITEADVTVHDNRLYAKWSDDPATRPRTHAIPCGYLVASGTLDDDRGGWFSYRLGTDDGNYDLHLSHVKDEGHYCGEAGLFIECRLDGARMVLAPFPQKTKIAPHIRRTIDIAAEAVPKMALDWQPLVDASAPGRALFTTDEILNQEGLEAPVYPAERYDCKGWSGKNLVHQGTDFGEWNTQVWLTGTASASVSCAQQKVCVHAKLRARKAIARWALAKAGIAENTPEMDRIYRPRPPKNDAAKPATST